MNRTKLIFSAQCILGKCAEILIDDMSKVGYMIDVEQWEGNVSKVTKEILLVSDMRLKQVVNMNTNKSMEIDEDLLDEALDENNIIENWVEKKLKLKKGNKYYIQGFQLKWDGPFYKDITFEIHTEAAFDISKIGFINDGSFDDLYWKIYDIEYNKRENPGELGLIHGDVEPDEGLIDPYHIIYDGKKVSVNRFTIKRWLRGESYMTFNWK